MRLRLLYWYWQFFNFIGRRIIGPCFVVGGLIVAGFNFPSLLPGGTINVDGNQSTDIGFRLIGVLVPLVVAALGVALYRAQPYYPQGIIERGHNDT